MGKLFTSVFAGTNPLWEGFLISLACAFAIGFFLAFCYSRRVASCTRSFFATLAVLPAVVCLVIFTVNGSLGAGIAVAGAFSLVRFRSAPGSGREICAVFVCMAVGLTLGMGFVGYGVLFALLAEAVLLLYSRVSFGVGGRASAERELRITVPEDLDYAGAFDDLLKEYTVTCRTVQVKTVNMGALRRIKYRVTLKDPSRERELMDAIRTRNGNLEVALSELDSENLEL
ncbi:MAG: DUF4956 domain-containing protein [Clostridia bacterium]|nr:DUF4956 domain-containing protein [Clostridia bacterium]